MSIKKSAFIALSDYLEEKLQFTDGVPSVSWVDKDLGQFELMQEAIISLPLPAVLISFPDTAYEATLGKDQTGKGLVRLRIGFENYYDAGTASPNRALALQFFDFNERVHQAATEFQMEQMSTLNRTAEAEDTNHGAVIITEIIYEYTLYDPGTNTNQQTTSTELKVNLVADARPPAPESDWVIPTTNP
jgi:hypothetical protein